MSKVGIFKNIMLIGGKITLEQHLGTLAVVEYRAKGPGGYARRQRKSDASLSHLPPSPVPLLAPSVQEENTVCEPPVMGSDGTAHEIVVVQNADEERNLHEDAHHSAIDVSPIPPSIGEDLKDAENRKDDSSDSMEICADVPVAVAGGGECGEEGVVPLANATIMPDVIELETEMKDKMSLAPSPPNENSKEKEVEERPEGEKRDND
jgi:hypothetical protein